MKFILGLLFVLFVSISYAQDNAGNITIEDGGNIIKERKNAVYIESFGNGILITSFNYERIVFSNKNQFAFRGGFGFTPLSSRNLFSIPFEASVVFGKNAHHFEFGIGFTNYFTRMKNKSDTGDERGQSDYSIMLVPRIGYRLTAKNRLLIRIGFTPVLELPVLSEFDKHFQPYGGISFGYLF